MLARKREIVWGRRYGNLPIKADYRAHEVAFALLREKLGDRKGLRVLDIATGTGALAQRVVDHFPDWQVEINDFPGEALVSGLKKHACDLNGPFTFGGGYDVVMAVEILEHLENPWDFLRQIRSVLKPGGALVLSTPNVDSLLDRLTYLTAGHPFYFGERGYTNSEGHITPMPDWMFRKVAGAAGFTQFELQGADTGPHFGLRAYAKLVLVLPLVPFMRDLNDRSVNVYFCS